jgi:hypothetical protein
MYVCTGGFALEPLCTYALVGALSPTLSRAPYACSDATSTGLCSSGHEKQFSEKCASPFRNSDAEIVRMRGERAFACRCVLGCVRGRGACAFSVCVCVRVRECVRVRIPYATPEGVPDTLIARAGEDRKDQNLLTATGSWFRSVGETPSVRFRSIAITLDQVCSLFIAPVRIACPHGALLGSRSPTLPGRCAHISVCRTRSQNHARACVRARSQINAVACARASTAGAHSPAVSPWCTGTSGQRHYGCTCRWAVRGR